MIDNNAFMLTDEELVRYNAWASKIAEAMVNADIESWNLDVTFSFSNLGISIIAHSASSSDNRGDLVIRNDLE